MWGSPYGRPYSALCGVCVRHETVGRILIALPSVVYKSLGCMMMGSGGVGGLSVAPVLNGEPPKITQDLNHSVGDAS